jgi:hypothetical protein
LGIKGHLRASHIKDRVGSVNRSGSTRNSARTDSLLQTHVDSEASTFHFGKQPMNKSTVWQLCLSHRISQQGLRRTRETGCENRIIHSFVARRFRAVATAIRQGDQINTPRRTNRTVTAVTFAAAKPWRRHRCVTLAA